MSQGNENKPKPKGIVGGGSASTMSQMMRNMVETTPVGSAQVDLTALPDIPMPNLEGVEVTVPSPGDVTEQDILERFNQLCYELADRKVRKAGDTVQMGDEVLLDLLGYMGGKVIPFSPQSNVRFVLEPDSFRPGFGNSIAGATVGDTIPVTTQFTYDDIVKGEAQATAVFVVGIRGAAEIQFPEAMDSPDFLSRLERGNTLDEVMQTISDEITDYRSSAMVIQAMDLVMETLASQNKVPIPPKLIEEEIRLWWSRGEGAYLAAKGVSRQDQESALQGWLADSELKKNAELRLRSAMIVQAYLRETAEDLQAEEIEAFVDEFARVNNIDAAAWKASMANDDAEKTALVEKYLYMSAVSDIMDQVTVHFEGAEG